MKEIALVFYPGHLGPIGPKGPRSELRTAGRGILWDAPVKAVPEPAASDLVLHGGFYRALTYQDAAAHTGVDVKRLRELAKGSHVTTAEYQPPGEGEKPVPVLVLDRQTRVRIREELQAPAAAPAPQSDPKE